MTVRWPDTVEEILGGDHVLALAYVTPARGVVILPVTNFGLRDREAGTISAVNTSVGAWRKLERMRANPRVALAYHTREHALTGRPEYVLVQGTASLSPPVEDYPSTILDNWERFEPWSADGPLWRRWRRVYGLRVEIRVAVERILVWPDLSARGEPEVLGGPLGGEPPPQSPPRNGTAPRIDARRAGAAAARLPHSIIGWAGADGFPVVVPASVTAAERDGIALEVPAGAPGGGRRAGLCAHWFSEGVRGQNQRKHTGWMQATNGSVLYMPHTRSNYRMPDSMLLYRIVTGLFTRLWYRRARRAGFEF